MIGVGPLCHTIGKYSKSDDFKIQSFFYLILPSIKGWLFLPNKELYSWPLLGITNKTVEQNTLLRYYVKKHVGDVGKFDALETIPAPERRKTCNIRLHLLLKP